MSEYRAEDGPICDRDGKPLDFEALADEAQRGYDVSHLRKRRRRSRNG